MIFCTLYRAQDDINESVDEWNVQWLYESRREFDKISHSATKASLSPLPLPSLSLSLSLSRFSRRISIRSVAATRIPRSATRRRGREQRGLRDRAGREKLHRVCSRTIEAWREIRNFTPRGSIAGSLQPAESLVTRRAGSSASRSLPGYAPYAPTLASTRLEIALGISSPGVSLDQTPFTLPNSAQHLAALSASLAESLSLLLVPFYSFYCYSVVCSCLFVG